MYRRRNRWEVRRVLPHRLRPRGCPNLAYRRNRFGRIPRWVTQKQAKEIQQARLKRNESLPPGEKEPNPFLTFDKQRLGSVIARGDRARSHMRAGPLTLAQHAAAMGRKKAWKHKKRYSKPGRRSGRYIDPHFRPGQSSPGLRPPGEGFATLGNALGMR